MYINSYYNSIIEIHRIPLIDKSNSVDEVPSSDFVDRRTVHCCCLLQKKIASYDRDIFFHIVINLSSHTEI
jgi:hypothetical protein